MPRKDLTEIVMIVDRSGSMGPIRVEAENGINNFIAEQAKLPGDANLTMIQFDDTIDVLYKALPIRTAPHYSMHPRNFTALFDAIGKAISETGERLKLLNENERPGLVVVVIVTDGQENASHEYNRARIKAMIDEQTTKWQWQFTFLAANLDAFAEAQGMGIPMAAAANYVPSTTRQAYASASNNVTRMRGASLNDQTVVNAFTEEEITAMSQDPDALKT